MVNKLFARQQLSRLQDVIEEEVKAALMEMPPTKALGPNGFSALFYQKYWHQVSSSLVSFIHAFMFNDISL